MDDLTPGIAALHAGVTPDTIRHWTDSGHLPCRRTETGTRLIDPADLQKFLAAREHRRAAAAAAR